METEKVRISTAQFFIMMFIARTATALGINARALGGENMLESAVSWLLAMGAGLVISLPLWGLYRQCPSLSVGEAAVQAFGKLGRVVPALYLLYFVLCGGISLGMFEIFLLDTVNPDFSSNLVICAILAVAVYGALRGIETAARCAGCVFAIFLLGTGLVFGITAFRFSPENVEPVFQNGPAQTIRGAVVFLARTSVFADMAVLLPIARGRKAAGFWGWAGGSTLFVVLLLLLLAGCLGPYAATQNFPVYTLSSLTEVRSMQRLDAVFAGIWMMGLIVKLSCELYACRVCFASAASRKLPKTAVLSCAAAVLALAFLAAENKPAQAVLLDGGLLLPATVLTAGALPLLVLVGHRLKFRKQRGKSK